MKLNKIFAFPLLTLVGILAFTSCGDDVTEVTEIIGSTVVKKYVPVEPKDWTWDDDLACYVYKFKIDELTQAVYNDGTIVASVFVDPGTEGERQELLPFLFTYDFIIDDKITGVYTENVNCSIVPGYVVFYVQGSDRAKGEVYNTYQFKVSLIGDNSLFN